jgi:hypothetical protein
METGAVKINIWEGTFGPTAAANLAVSPVGIATVVPASFLETPRSVEFANGVE